jgi:hypothetical protein
VKSPLQLDSLIHTLRGQKVMLDADLAALYGVSTKAFNQAIKRNADRFPADFRFQLTSEEQESLRSQIVTLETAEETNRSQIVTGSSGRGRHSKYLPWAFTEHRAIMAATILNSPTAAAMSVFIVRAFVQMREQLMTNAEVLKRLAEIDKTLLKRDRSLQILWQELQPLLQPPTSPPRRPIGFHP